METFPRPIGRLRVAPPFTASPFTELSGDDRRLIIRKSWGSNTGTIRIGETDIDAFETETPDAG